MDIWINISPELSKITGNNFQSQNASIAGSIFIKVYFS